MQKTPLLLAPVLASMPLAANVLHGAAACIRFARHFARSGVRWPQTARPARRPSSQIKPRLRQRQAPCQPFRVAGSDRKAKLSRRDGSPRVVASDSHGYQEREALGAPKRPSPGAG